MSWAMNTTEEWYWNSAMSAEMAMNTTSRPRIQTSCFFSDMFLMMLPLMKSMVRVDDDVSTSDESVDMEADRTSTMTRPMSTSGKVDSIVGMMES